MTIDDRIRDEKLQYCIYRATANISLLSGIIDKYEYLTCEEVLPPQQHRIIEEATFTHSRLGKTFKKQTKIIGEQRVNILRLYCPRV